MSPRPLSAALATLPFVLVLAGCGQKAPEAAPKSTAAPRPPPRRRETARSDSRAHDFGGPGDGSGGRPRSARHGRVHPARPLRARRKGHGTRGKGPRRRGGTRVAEGQPMLTLETAYLKLDVARAEAEAARAAAVLADAERDFGRRSSSGRSRSHLRRFERSQAAFEGAKASRLGAQAGLDLAKQRLSDAVLGAPVDGVVLERQVDVGERLSEGTVTFVVVQTARPQAPLPRSRALPRRGRARRQGTSHGRPVPGRDLRRHRLRRRPRARPREPDVCRRGTLPEPRRAPAPRALRARRARAAGGAAVRTFS